MSDESIVLLAGGAGVRAVHDWVASRVRDRIGGVHLQSSVTAAHDPALDDYAFGCLRPLRGECALITVPREAGHRAAAGVVSSVPTVAGVGGAVVAVGRVGQGPGPGDTVFLPFVEHRIRKQAEMASVRYEPNTLWYWYDPTLVFQ